MDHSAYVRVLLSVWVGLGLGQLVQSLHRIARFTGTVRWDWLAVTWAGLAFLMYVQTWWAYFTLLESPLWSNLFAFFLPLAVFVVLYLICASALPDVAKAPEGSVVDLGAHYLAQHRYFFALWGILLVLASVVSLLVRDGFHPLGGDGLRLAGIAGAIVLVRSGNRRVHVVVTLLSLVALVAYIVLFTLKLG